RRCSLFAFRSSSDQPAASSEQRTSNSEQRANMKFTITREQLQEGLVAVAASVPSKTTLPVLSNILVEATKDGLRLSGTDLDIAVSTTVAASVDQEGAITLPARKFVEIVRELPSAAMRITGSVEQLVTIESGRQTLMHLCLS